jgi:hypothetical protein
MGWRRQPRLSGAEGGVQWRSFPRPPWSGSARRGSTQQGPAVPAASAGPGIARAGAAAGSVARPPWMGAARHGAARPSLAGTTPDDEEPRADSDVGAGFSIDAHGRSGRYGPRPLPGVPAPAAKRPGWRVPGAAGSITRTRSPAAPGGPVAGPLEAIGSGPGAAVLEGVVGAGHRIGPGCPRASSRPSTSHRPTPGAAACQRGVQAAGAVGLLGYGAWRRARRDA